MYTTHQKECRRETTGSKNELLTRDFALQKKSPIPSEINFYNNRNYYWLALSESDFLETSLNIIQKIGLITIKKHISIRNQMVFGEISSFAVDFR